MLVMDELSADEARGLATAANLRRAFGTPDAAPLPQSFGVLLGRLRELDAQPPSRQSGAPRPGA